MYETGYSNIPVNPPPAPQRTVRRIDASGLRLVLAGSLLVFLDFRLLGFDVLPDFAGYLIIFFGLRRLAEYHPMFRKSSAFTLLIFILSFSDLYSAEQADLSLSEALRIFSLIAAPVALIFSMLALFYTTSGISALAGQTGNPELQDTSRRMFVIKGAMSVASTLILPVVLFFPAAAAVLGIPAALIGFVVEIIYLVYLNRAFHALDDQEIEENR